MHSICRAADTAPTQSHARCSEHGGEIHASTHGMQAGWLFYSWTAQTVSKNGGQPDEYELPLSCTVYCQPQLHLRTSRLIQSPDPACQWNQGTRKHDNTVPPSPQFHQVTSMQLQTATPAGLWAQMHGSTRAAISRHLLHPSPANRAKAALKGCCSAQVTASCPGSAMC